MKSYESVVDGIVRYMDKELFPKMNDFQELVARIAVARLYEDDVKHALHHNSIVKAFGLIDSNGMVDVDRLMKDIRKEISRKGKLEIAIPMFGKMTFSPEDVDALHREIDAE